ncbi:hypothetical protein ACJX0J_010418 [Zea mays]
MDIQHISILVLGASVCCMQGSNLQIFMIGWCLCLRLRYDFDKFVVSHGLTCPHQQQHQHCTQMVHFIGRGRLPISKQVYQNFIGDKEKFSIIPRYLTKENDIWNGENF